VTGTVRPFVVAEINQEYGVGLIEQDYVEYQNRTALIASDLLPAQQ
jgi:hypothetical protein